MQFSTGQKYIVKNSQGFVTCIKRHCPHYEIVFIDGRSAGGYDKLSDVIVVAEDIYTCSGIGYKILDEDTGEVVVRRGF